MGKMALGNMVIRGYMVGNTRDNIMGKMPLGNMVIRSSIVGNTRDNIMGKKALGNMVIRGSATLRRSPISPISHSLRQMQIMSCERKGTNISYRVGGDRGGMWGVLLGWSTKIALQGEKINWLYKAN